MGALPLVNALQAVAASKLPPEVAAYFEAGSWDEVSATEAVGAWDRFRFLPRALRDVASIDTSVEILGASLRCPVLVAPTAYQRLAHLEGEAEMARGVAAAGSLLVVSTRATVRLEDIAAAGCPWWLQVYMLRDRDIVAALVARAAAAGASALVLTGDTPMIGVKRRASVPLPLSVDEQLVNLGQHVRSGADVQASIEQDPTVTDDAIGWLASVSGLPVLVKGVLRADDARRFLAAGASGVVVSNHGGRQLDRAVPTAAALRAVVEAVSGEGEVLVDGGIRDGLSAATALALGARAVLVGRPALWALAAGGAAVVEALISSLDADLRQAMALLGAASLAELDPGLVTQ